MERKINVYVTAKDIREGCRMDIENCPLARAIGRKLRPGLTASLASVLDIEGPRGARLHRQDTPEPMMSFIHRFDREQPVKPGRFTLSLPERVLA